MYQSAAKSLVVVLLVLALSGCSLGYYLQSARGQASLMSKRRPIPEVLADPATPERLRERLLLVQRARLFAVEALRLPAKKGFQTYADLDRPYAVWNVVATPEFSLEPLEWCFPVAGCVSYRGYFREGPAAEFAASLRNKGYDVAVRGVAAYSTLGYFDDPVLNTMMRWDDAQLVAIIFHELAHQLLYVKGDTPFNESFASVVEHEGMRRWLIHTNTDSTGYASRLEDERCFRALVATARTRLQALYARGGEPGALRKDKSKVFADLHASYEQAEQSGALSPAYREWFEQALNNAHLASAGAYQQWVPALRSMLLRSGGKLGSFYEEARRLSKLTREERAAVLNEVDAAEGPVTCAATSE